MKKLLLFLSLLFIMSLSVFAGETFKCRKETFFYDIEGRTSSNEFLFINNFMIFPHDNYYRKYIFLLEMIRPVTMKLLENIILTI